MMGRSTTTEARATSADFLEGLDRRSFGGGDSAFERAYLRAMRRNRVRAALGTMRAREVRSLIGNVCLTRQSVVKRITRGGCRDARVLRRQIDYVTRQGTLSAWGNAAGIGVDALEAVDVAAVVESWTAGWRGASRYGHSDHGLLSLPRDADPETRTQRKWPKPMPGQAEARRLKLPKQQSILREWQ